MDGGAWDRVFDRIDRVVAGAPANDDALKAEVTALLSQAMADGLVDRELDPHDSARWLIRLLRAEADLHTADDASLSTLRVIVTRWLHPGRLDVEAVPSTGNDALR